MTEPTIPIDDRRLRPAPRANSKVMLIAALALGGCPSEPPAGEPCAGEGDPAVALANRQGGHELADGDEIEVFPPPQGGVFAELDVTIENLAVSELDYLRIRIESIATGDELANVRFLGSILPLSCTEGVGLQVDAVPVAFSDAVTLTDADGVRARLIGGLETSVGAFETRYEVVLHTTDY